MIKNIYLIITLAFILSISSAQAIYVRPAEVSVYNSTLENISEAIPFTATAKVSIIIVPPAEIAIANESKLAGNENSKALAGITGAFLASGNEILNKNVFLLFEFAIISGLIFTLLFRKIFYKSIS